MCKDKLPIPKINVRRAPGVRKGYARFSQRVERRIEIGVTFCASIEINKDAASSSFGERFAAELREVEAMPDGALALELVARSVKSALVVLTDSESQYIRLGTRRTGERRESERVAREELNPRLVLLRRTIDALYGKEEGAWIHGLKGKTLRKPGRVLPQARDLVDTLKTEQRPPRLVARRPIARSERESWLCQVEPAYDRLVAVTKDVERLERAEEHACSVRDLALERFDDVYGEAFAYAHSVYGWPVSASGSSGNCGLPSSAAGWIVKPAGNGRRGRKAGAA